MTFVNGYSCIYVCVLHGLAFHFYSTMTLSEFSFSFRVLPLSSSWIEPDNTKYYIILLFHFCVFHLSETWEHHIMFLFINIVNYYHYIQPSHSNWFLLYRCVLIHLLASWLVCLPSLLCAFLSSALFLFVFLCVSCSFLVNCLLTWFFFKSLFHCHFFSPSV